MLGARKEEWLKEFYNLVQSFTRSMVFGVSLLYTMETWWIGTYLDFWKLIGFFLLTIPVNLYLIPLTSKKESMPFLQVFRHGIRNKGMAVLSSTIILTVLRIITPFEAPYEKDLTTIMLLSIPVGIGADVAQILNIFAKQRQSSPGKKSNRSSWKFMIDNLASTSAGALFVCLPVAPTMEIPSLAARMQYKQEMALIILSLVLSYVIVFSSGITQTPPSGKGSSGAKIWPVAETLVSYAASLFVALMILALFGRVTLNLAIEQVLSLVVVLGFPAAIGGAAGRLVL